MKKGIRKRITAFTLAVLLMGTSIQLPVMAAGDCEHHTEHSVDCGYTEGTEGSDCTHVHGEECYSEVTSCVHSHDGECGYVEAVEGSECNHSHDESCGENGAECTHTEHTSDCGYKEAQEGSACNHVCSEESGCIQSEENCNHSHDENCGYKEAVEGTPCSFDCEDCASEESGHENEEQQDEEETDTCICEDKCTADAVNEECPVCSLEEADLALCVGEETIICTCETDDPAFHATNCSAYIAPENPQCYCAEKCTEDTLNVWCDVCGMQGVSACQGEDMAAEYETAKSGTTGECTWEFQTHNTVEKWLIIDGLGKMEDYSEGGSPWRGDVIERIIIGPGVTHIGSYAFEGIRNTEVVIGKGVTSIGEGAFINSDLPAMNIPDSVTSIGAYAFKDCSQLVQLKLGTGITSIPEGMCKNATKLVSVDDIPDTLTSIGKEAFMNTIIRTMEIPNSVTEIGAYAFSGSQLHTLKLGTGITSIPDGMCKNTKLSEFTIPDKVTSIGAEAFMSTNLKNVDIPDSVTSIGEYAFSNSQLDTLTLGSGITSISKGMCKSTWLDSITIPDTVTSIGEEAFRYTYLEAVDIPDSVTEIGAYAFGSAWLQTLTLGTGITSIPQGMCEGCTDLTSIEIPDTVTSIGRDAFNLCGLQNLVIGEKVTSIGYGAFCGCEDLKTVTINGALTECDDTAFKLCFQLESVTFGEKVEVLGSYMFQGCLELESVTFQGNKIKEIPRYMFEYCQKLTAITLPEGVERIGASAFANSALQSITIPESVVEIGGFAFHAPLQYGVNVPCKWHDNPLYSFHEDVIVTIAEHSYSDEADRECNACGYTVPIVTEVSVSPTNVSVEIGSTKQFEAVVELGENVQASRTVTWSVEGKTSAFTSIDSTGMLTIGADETATSLTVIATADADPTMNATASVTVTTADIGNATVVLSDAEDMSYDGTAKVPTVVVKVGTTTLTENVHYVINYSNSNGGAGNHTNAGTVTAIISGKGNYTGTAMQQPTFTIAKATPHIVSVQGTAITYGDALSASTVNGTVQYSESDNTSVNGSFAWVDASVKPAVADSNSTEYAVIFTPSNSVNYNTVNTTAKLIVNKAENAPDMPGSTMNVSNKYTKIGDVPLPDGWEWQDADKETELVVNTLETPIAVYVGTDRGNYIIESVEIKVTRANHDHVESKVLFDTDAGEQAPTCTQDGFGHVECTVEGCDEILRTNVVADALGHNYISKVTKQPTTTEEGIMTYTCSRCDDFYTKPISKLTSSGSGSGNNSGNDETSGSSGGGSVNDTPTTETPAPPTISGVTTAPLMPQPGEKVPVVEPDEGTDNPEPFIKGKDGKEGWDVIRDESLDAGEGDTVTVDMNGTTVVPGDVLDEIKGKDITMVFDLGNGVTWSVNGKDITSDNVGDIDFEVKVGADANDGIPVEVRNTVTGESYFVNISLTYEGEFGFEAVLSVNLEKENAGLYANLFYYNPQTNEMEFICSDEIAEDGTVELTFTHASEYTIVIDEVAFNAPASSEEDILPEIGVEAEGDNAETDNATDTTDVSDPLVMASKDADSAWWIVLLIAVLAVAGIAGFVIYSKKNKSE